MTQDKTDLYVQIVPFTNADHKIITENKANPLQRIKVDENTTLRTISKYVLQQANASEQGNLKVTLHAPYNSKCIQLPLTMTVADFLLITSQDTQGEIRYRFDKNVESRPKVTSSRRQISTAIPNSAYRNFPAVQSAYQYSTNMNSSIPLNANRSKERYQSFPYIQQPQPPPTFQSSFDFIQKMNKTLNNIDTKYNMTENASKPLKKPKKKPPPQEPPPPPIQPPPNQYELPNFNNSIGMDSMNSIFHTGFQLYSNSFGSFPHIDSISIGNAQNDSEKAPQSTESISLKKDLEQILRK